MKKSSVLVLVVAAACMIPSGEVRLAPAEARPNWHDQVFWGIHYDLHANAQDTVLGRDLTPEHLRARLLETRPDWVQTDCKGHPGYTSWPTSVGSTSPGVVKDSLRIYRDVTRELGIKLGVHYSGIWDARAIELHPDWARVDAEGRRDPHITCRLHGYDEQLLIPQMLEILEKYDVDGFWVDGENWADLPCWCDRCKAEFTRRTGIREIPTKPGQAHWSEWLAFHRQLFVEHVTKYANAVHARKPSCLVTSNWIYSAREPDPVATPVDYLTGDFSHSWGAASAALEGRVYDGRGMSWDLMAWSFTQTGHGGDSEPWSTKTLTHLCQELSEPLALGGSIMVYEVPQRSGWLTGWHNTLLAEVGRFCRARQEACWKSRTVPEAAVLLLPEFYYAHNSPLFNYGAAMQPVEGALQALLEAHHSTDVLTEADALRRIKDYKLVVVPEQTPFSPGLLQALEEYVRGGGNLVLSGENLSRDSSELAGASPRGEPIAGSTYLRAGDKAIGVTGHWQPVTPAAGTEAVAYRLNEQEPTRNSTDQVLVTRRRLGAGTILAIHGPLFRDYDLTHYPLLRQFIAELTDQLGISWTATVEGPAWLEMVLRQKERKLVVNLINRGAGETLSPDRVIVEDLPPLENIVVRVRRNARPASVKLVPADLPLDWSYGDGVVTVRVPRVEIHRAVVIE